MISLDAKSHQISPYRTASRLLIRGKIGLLKVECPKFEGHRTPNEDNYQKSVS